MFVKVFHENSNMGLSPDPDVIDMDIVPMQEYLGNEEKYISHNQMQQPEITTMNTKLVHHQHHHSTQAGHVLSLQFVRRSRFYENAV